MRKCLWTAVALLLVAPCAEAADMPDFLRGTVSAPVARSTNWRGFYVGVQGAYGSGDMDFGTANQDLASRILNHSAFDQNTDTSGDPAKDTRVSAWQILGTTSVRNSGYGGFVGYNGQWSDVVMGVELNYTHGDFFGSSSGSQGQANQTAVPNYIALVESLGYASMKVHDFGSFRIRAGYAWDCFLPYAFAGAALGQADIYRSALINISYAPAVLPQTVPNIPSFSGSLSDTENAHFIYGYAWGLGFDYMLYSNLFLRAEWEHLRFTSAVDTTINTVRAGIGYKF